MRDQAFLGHVYTFLQTMVLYSARTRRVCIDLYQERILKKRHQYGLPLLNSVSQLGLDERSMARLARMPSEARRLVDEGGLTEDDRDTLLEKIEEKIMWNGSQKRSTIRARQKELLDELKQAFVESSFKTSGVSGELSHAAPALEYVRGLTD